MKTIFRLLITAFGVMVAAELVPGITVASFWTALLVALVLAVLNVLIGIPLKVVTAPISLVTLGFFLLVINAFVFWLANFVKGFSVEGFWPAFFGALIVTAFSMVGKALVKKKD